MRQPVMFISDRVNVIGLSNYLKLLELLHSLGIRAVSIDQHSGGGYWEEKYILPVKRALAYCQELGMDVYITAHDGSKCDYGSPCGLSVIQHKSHKPRLKETRIDSHRVQFQMMLVTNRAYHFTYSANKPCTPHLFDATNENWQLVKWSKASEGQLEFRSAKGSGLHNLTFIAEDDGTPLNVYISEHGSHGDPASIQPRTFQDGSGQWWYRGGKGISGNAFCRTPNFADRYSRLKAYRDTFGKIAQTYSEFIGNPIVGTRLEWDEFTSLGQMCGEYNMLLDMKTCGAISQTLFGPAIVDARPQDWEHPAKNNTKDTWGRSGDVFTSTIVIGENDGLIGCAWQEQTTPELCADTKLLSHPTAMAGVNVEYSDPQHFYDAGFRAAGIYYYPQGEKEDGSKIGWLDIPQDKVARIVEVFRSVP